MPLTDNMLVKIVPASGDTFIKNLIDNSNIAANGAGTLTYDSVNNGWQVQGTRTGTFTNGSTGYENNTITMAFRFKCNSRSDDFAEYLRFATSASGEYGGRVSNAGGSTGVIRISESAAGSGATIIGTPTYTTGNFITVVIRISDTTAAIPTLDGWRNQVSRANSNPDYTNSPIVANRDSFGAVDTFAINGGGGQNITLTHAAFWQRALTNAEAAAVADDIEGQLNPVTGVTINCSVGNTSCEGKTAIVNLAAVVSGQVGNTSANGLTSTITNTSDTLIITSKGNATANGSLANVALNIAISVLVGNVTANGSLANIINTTQFVTDTLINNTGTILGSQPVYWTWLINGRIGSLDSVSIIDGTGTTAPNGKLTINGLPLGDGVLLISIRNTSAEDDFVYYEAGTVV